MTTHALVVPWPVTQGLVTWCGHSHTDKDLAGDFVASSPDAVTCQRCKVAMRHALKNLEEWVPRLEEDRCPVCNGMGRYYDAGHALAKTCSCRGG